MDRSEQGPMVLGVPEKFWETAFLPLRSIVLVAHLILLCTKTRIFSTLTCDSRNYEEAISRGSYRRTLTLGKNTGGPRCQVRTATILRLLDLLLRPALRMLGLLPHPPHRMLDPLPRLLLRLISLLPRQLIKVLVRLRRQGPGPAQHTARLRRVVRHPRRDLRPGREERAIAV